MPQARRALGWRCAAAAAALLFLVHPAAAATESAAAKNADQYIASGNLKAAEIELRNAIREAPQDAQLRTRLARVYLQLGDPISAEREARAARERNGEEADYLPVLADALLRQGKFADLSDLVQPGHRAPALESKIRTALGIAAAGLHDRAKAEALLREATKLDPSAVKPKIALARLVAASNPTEANMLLDQALAADPRSVEALLVKGELARAQGDAKAAMSRFDEALQIDPKNAAARLSRASLNLAQGKYKAVDEDLDPVLKASPSNFLANYLRGLELARQQQYAAADRIFDRLSPVFPRFAGGYYLQGATKLALGQNAQAEAILGKYLALVPNDARASRLIATAALRQRAPGRAIEYLKPVVDKSPPDAQSLTLLGNAYVAAGKPELALQQFEKASALDPGNAGIKTRMALSEISAGQGKEGLAELERVFDTQSGATVAGPTLVLSQLRAGQVDKAADVASALIKRDANNPLYQTLLGMVKTAQHDVPAAEAAFRAALAHEPGFAPAIRDLAALYMASGRFDDAKKVYLDRLAKQGDNEAALLGLANIAIAQKKWPEATDYVNRARSAAPNDTAPGLLLARIYELQQNWADAKAVASALSAQFPSDLEVLEALARAQLGAGDTNGAISSYKRAHELAPNSLPVLSRYLALLYSAKYYQEARGVLQEAIDRNPKNIPLKVDLLRVTAALDGVDAAVAKANSFAKDDPSSSAYDLAGAEIYQNAARFAEATALLEKAAAARPNDDAVTTALARLYVRTGHFTQAEQILKRRLANDPKNVEVRRVLGPLYLATGRTADAKKIYTDLLAQKPNDLNSLLGLADVAIVDKKWSEALDDITRARNAAPNDPAPGLKLVGLYGMRQDWKNATATAAELAAKFPSNFDVLDAEARAQLGAGDAKAAIAIYKHAYELAPNSAQILSRYVSALNAAKNYPEARSVLQAALGRAPQNTSLKGDLIRVEAEIGGVDAGLAKAREMAKADPGNTLYDLASAELLAKAGRGKEAAALLEKALAAKPADDGLRAALARVYGNAGDSAKAEALLTARLKTEPGDFPIGATLASLYLESKNYDAATTEYFFKQLSAISYGGATLPDDLYHRMQALAVKYTGHRIVFFTGWGSTETAPTATATYWETERVGLIGLPFPGVELKMVPVGDKYELRLRGIIVTPGYYKRPDLTAEMFDEEGFYKIGDAGDFVDPNDPAQGLVFKGRVVEDFKLSSGTFVHVGSLRVAAIAAASPVIQDAVVAGQDKEFVALLAWPNILACRQIAGDAQAPVDALIANAKVIETVRAGIARHNAANPGSSNKIRRVLLMAEPPSIDGNELTDKGYINQRATLERRAALVDRLYAAQPDMDVIVV